MANKTYQLTLPKVYPKAG